mgnify:CR=1 FL=1
MPKVIVTADWHIRPGGVIWRHRARPCGDIQFALQQIDSYIQQESPDSVWILGDTFHASYNASSCVDIISAIRDWPNVYFVQGQHDYSSPPWLEVLKLGRHLSGVQSIAGLRVAGIDWVVRASDFYDFISQLASCDVLITHQVFKEFVPGGQVSYMQIENPPFRFLFSGDFHEPRVIQHDNFTFLSPGSPAVNTIAENFQSYAWLFDGENLTSLPLKKRRIISVAVDTKEAAEEFVANNPVENFLDPDLPGDLIHPLLVVQAPMPVFKVISSAYADCYVVPRRSANRDSDAEVQSADSGPVDQSLRSSFFKVFEEQFGLGNAVLDLISAAGTSGAEKDSLFRRCLERVKANINDPRLEQFYADH